MKKFGLVYWIVTAVLLLIIPFVINMGRQPSADLSELSYFFLTMLSAFIWGLVTGFKFRSENPATAKSFFKIVLAVVIACAVGGFIVRQVAEVASSFGAKTSNEYNIVNPL